MVDVPYRPASPVRLAAYGLIAAFSLHFLMPLLPVSPTVLRWIEVLVGFMALSWLTSLLYNDYRRGGMLLSSAREELLLVGAFGLFWLAVAAIFRAWHRGQSPATAAESLLGFPVAPIAGIAPGTGAAGVAPAHPNAGAAFSGGNLPYVPHPVNTLPTVVPQAMGSPLRRVTYIVEEVWQRYF
ncbi:hypothetical protein DACRYDRAFT_24741 [Dacryopinax primogenitus]|uniref:Uncharacterized protein n=1 Tax=Dacryopinax primogenitus (strain DJM 731) TaxID=1858805 RepID=M5FRI3_DACPD|nr:uncharacterized protein DACRYDRAFT_24741 [Dacryopinax primogenitus]EJT98293.1 hypothetical protein DACRYDRAFT_24741 [Dacryopinax primogenitus]